MMVRMITRLALACAGALLLGITAARATAPYLPSMGVLSYTEDKGGGHIYVMDAGRGLALRVLDDTKYGGFINWTPDGQQITYVHVSRLGKRVESYHLTNPTHTHIEPHSLQSYNYVWTPDGRCIIHGGGQGLYRYCAGDDSNTKLHEGIIRSIAPMQDAQTVFFVRRVRNAYDLYRLRLDTGRVVQITTDGVQKSRPSVSADGETIFYSAFKHDQSYLFRYDVTTGAVEQISSGGGEFNPAVSPDGRYVVYSAYRPETLWDIYLLELPTRQTRQLTRQPGAQINAVWMPQ